MFNEAIDTCAKERDLKDPNYMDRSLKVDLNIYISKT